MLSTIAVYYFLDSDIILNKAKFEQVIKYQISYFDKTKDPTEYFINGVIKDKPKEELDDNQNNAEGKNISKSNISSVNISSVNISDDHNTNNINQDQHNNLDNHDNHDNHDNQSVYSNTTITLNTNDQTKNNSTQNLIQNVQPSATGAGKKTLKFDKFPTDFIEDSGNKSDSNSKSNSNTNCNNSDRWFKIKTMKKLSNNLENQDKEVDKDDEDVNDFSNNENLIKLDRRSSVKQAEKNNIVEEHYVNKISHQPSQFAKVSMFNEELETEEIITQELSKLDRNNKKKSSVCDYENPPVLNNSDKDIELTDCNEIDSIENLNKDVKDNLLINDYSLETNNSQSNLNFTEKETKVSFNNLADKEVYERTKSKKNSRNTSSFNPSKKCLKNVIKYNTIEKNNINEGEEKNNEGNGGSESNDDDYQSGKPLKVSIQTNLILLSESNNNIHIIEENIDTHNDMNYEDFKGFSSVNTGFESTTRIYNIKSLLYKPKKITEKVDITPFKDNEGQKLKEINQENQKDNNNNNNNNINDNKELSEKYIDVPIKDYEGLTLMERLEFDKRPFGIYLRDNILTEHIVLNLFYLNSLFIPR